MSRNNKQYQQQFDMSRQSWSIEEDAAIAKLVDQHGIEDWTRIADMLGQQLGSQRRTGKQCRQRWHNHLSPDVSKQPWSDQEEQLLFTYHRNLGNRWKDISKLFHRRTDNDIKNHFYSTLRRSLRRLNKIIGQKNSTVQMREIKPSVLSTIMHYIYQRQQAGGQLIQSLRDLPLLIFEFAKFKPVKFNLKSANLDAIRQKTNHIFTLIASFNSQYEKNKQVRQDKKINLRKRSSLQFEVKFQEISIKSSSQEDPHPESCPQMDHDENKQQLSDHRRNHQQKLQQKTEMQEHCQSYHNYEEIPMTIFNQFDYSPKQSSRQPFPSHKHPQFLLQPQDIRYLHFHEPQEPSCIQLEHPQPAIDEEENKRSKLLQELLVDEVIEMEFTRGGD